METEKTTGTQGEQAALPPSAAPAAPTPADTDGPVEGSDALPKAG